MMNWFWYFSFIRYKALAMEVCQNDELVWYFDLNRFE